MNVGGATATRIEEIYAPNFEAAKFFPDWQPSVVDEHRDWMVPDHYDPSSGFPAPPSPVPMTKGSAITAARR